MTAERGASASINGGPFQPCTYAVQQDMQSVPSFAPQPSPSWSHVDAAGHFHAYDRTTDATDRYPTLATKSRQVSCPECQHDECEGGHTQTWLACRICDEAVSPGSLAGLHNVTVPGRKSWNVTVPGHVWGRSHVSVRVRDGDNEAFGIAIPGGIIQIGSDVETVLTGVGPMGWRQK